MKRIDWYVQCGNYRKFIVTAETPGGARRLFAKAYKQNPIITHGFTENDITQITAVANK